MSSSKAGAAPTLDRFKAPLRRGPWVDFVDSLIPDKPKRIPAEPGREDASRNFVLIAAARRGLKVVTRKQRDGSIWACLLSKNGEAEPVYRGRAGV